MDIETKGSKKNESRTSYIRFIFTWVISTTIIVSVLLHIVQDALLVISVAGLSIIFSAVLLKYIDVYERWVAHKEGIRHSVEEISTLIEKLGNMNMDNGNRE